jgi:hypothetical protein
MSRNKNTKSKAKTNKKTSHPPEYCKAFPPQVDNVKMVGDYGDTASNVRLYLTQRLEELGEKPYKKNGTLMCKLHNEEGTQHLMITQRGHSVWVRGSLSKWGGYKDEYQRYNLPRKKIGVVVRGVLDRLGLPAEWVKVHSVEIGIDILVSGKITDYTRYLRVAKGQKRIHKEKERTTYYQGSTQKLFKVYDKGEEIGILLPEGMCLLRMELTLKNGASCIGKRLGLLLPLHASDLEQDDTILSMIKQLHAMIDDTQPKQVIRTTGAVKDKPLEAAIMLLREAYGDTAVSKLVDRLQSEADAEEDKVKRKRLRDQATKVQGLYSKLEASYWKKIRKEIDEACNATHEHHRQR